ncbi:small hydrophobic protein [Bat paramyxovirus]|uniref:Small hydrophobic protein n=1 Tax=bat paramyxovirus 16797 TaxID=3070194 RepID=A0AA48FD92_9MONO|nr:small hydrophobic protein [Bat paramyxovirus]AYM47535.1 small hydrophobic protein [bat paramyxovirus 16797]
MDTENSSSLYLNARSLPDLPNKRRNGDKSAMAAQDMHLRIETINTINKFRHRIKSISKCILFGMAAIMIFMILAAVITGIIVNLTYMELSKKIDNENEQIYLMLQKLYTKCKENPMDFDWTTAIFQRIEEAEYKIADKTTQKVMQSFDKRFKTAIKDGKISDDSLFKFHVKFDKAEGIEIDAKASGKDDHDHHDYSQPYPTHLSRPRRPPRGTRSPPVTTEWKGPTGIPGVW